MTNKQNEAIQKIERIIHDLKTNGRRTIKYIGRIPESVECGNKYPAVFIEEGNEDYSWDGNVVAGQVSYEYELNLYLHHNIEKNRVEEINKIQNKINTAILQDLSLRNVVAYSRLISVEKGSLQNNEYSKEDVNQAGYYANNTVRKMTFRFWILDTRN